jgi:hypothetical protein
MVIEAKFLTPTSHWTLRAMIAANVPAQAKILVGVDLVGAHHNIGSG